MRTNVVTVRVAFFVYLALAVFLLVGAVSCVKGPKGDSIMGPMGNPGVDGQDGATGPTGANGSGCSVSAIPQGSPEAPAGGALITCADGSNSVLLNGLNGTSVTAVKLCPGNTVYPSKFVEVAFCIAGRLYGTYSANGGFSTELVPGSYSSNAIGSSCNLTVGANCQVSY